MNISGVVIWILTATAPGQPTPGYDSAYSTAAACEAARQHAQGVENFGPHSLKTTYQCAQVSWKGGG